MRAVLVCGEPSGDQLGAGLARELRKLVPDVAMTGVTGPAMRGAGVESWMDCSRFAVTGYWEAVRRLPLLLMSRAGVTRRMGNEKPDVFVGIDAPDLNIGLGKVAAAMGVPYVQYVCPSFWAWRHERAAQLAEHCDLVLALLPFERELCEKEGVAATFVGHRLVDEVEEDQDGQLRDRARAELGVAPGEKVLAVLPGSRSQELAMHGELFRQTAQLCAKSAAGLRVFWAPPAGSDWRPVAGDGHSCLPGGARKVLRAADAALVKSGTITLEAALAGCPQVVAYRISRFMSYLTSRKIEDVHSVTYSLPNLVLGDRLVSEYIMERAVPDAMAAELVGLLRGDGTARMREGYGRLRRLLGSGCDAKAARAVAGVVG